MVIRMTSEPRAMMLPLLVSTPVTVRSCPSRVSVVLLSRMVKAATLAEVVRCGWALMEAMPSAAASAGSSAERIITLSPA